MVALYKFLSLLSVFAAASAQSITIFSPEPNQSLSPGSSFLVVLDSSDGLTGFKDVSVAIGMLTCGVDAGSCSNSTTPMVGTLLYSGNFSPQRDDPAQPASQNFVREALFTLRLY